jgi:gas vesicle protein
MKTTERVGGLLIGAGIGAGIALLYAPVSGKETRKLIRRKAEEARDTVVEAGEQVRDRVAGAGESVADAARGVYRKSATMAAGAAGVFDAGRRAAKL